MVEKDTQPARVEPGVMRHPSRRELQAMFQARMWREYAMTFNGRLTTSGVDHKWVTAHLRVTKQYCILRAKQAIRDSRSA